MGETYFSNNKISNSLSSREKSNFARTHVTSPQTSLSVLKLEGLKFHIKTPHVNAIKVTYRIFEIFSAAEVWVFF